ncbi:C-type lectin domain family 2 member A-like isoform X3 [Carettochelys insculpta]|uniref:C-type lectin domain family 2 member A-like isoform X3 n=1 Tax=Carettochelys insculpta TaxID=44489 RepID=UPI003EBA4464
MVDKAEIQVPLQGPVNSNGHLESGRHPASDGRGKGRNKAYSGAAPAPVLSVGCGLTALAEGCLCGSAHNYYKKHRITLGLMVLVPIIIVSAVLTVLAAKPPSAAPGPPAVPCCPDSWIGYQQKCYYFSEEEGNWTYSRNHCSALGASLAGIDTLQDLAFLLRHKGTCDHWVGLRREWNQPWKWANGTEFDHWFAIRGGGDCAYLNDKDRVRSSRCYSERRWVCSKPAGYTMGTDPALGRGSH